MISTDDDNVLDTNIESLNCFEQIKNKEQMLLHIKEHERKTNVILLGSRMKPFIILMTDNERIIRHNFLNYFQKIINKFQCSDYNFIVLHNLFIEYFNTYMLYLNSKKIKTQDDYIKLKICKKKIKIIQKIKNNVKMKQM